MKHTRYITTAALAIASATAFAGGAQAASLQISDITASWVNPSGGANVNFSGNGSLTPSVSWGNPSPSSGDQSGYDLTILGDPVPNPGADIDDIFDVAEFTHNNNPIASGTGINSVELNVEADILLDGATQVSDAMFRFLFDHDETPNVSGDCPDQPASERCADIVTTSLLNDTSTFTFEDTVYTLTILGFVKDDEFTSVFVSGEGGSNSGTVRASFTAAPVPLPAAGWLLLGAIGGLGAFRRFRKA